MEKLLNLNIFNLNGFEDYHIRGEIMVRIMINLVLIVTISLAFYFI